MEEITYQGETYRPITRDGLYLATQDGKVLSKKRGEPILLSLQCRADGSRYYFLSLKGHKRRTVVSIKRVIYAARKRVFLQDLKPGKVYYVDDNDRALCASREAFSRWLHRYDNAKAIRDPADRVAKLIGNLRLQEQYHRNRDIQPLRDKLEAMKPGLLLYTRALIVGDRDRAQELVDEAVSMFLSAVCARKVIVADLSGYLKGIIRNYRTKRRKLMQQSLPDEDRFMPESLDEWE